MFPNVLSMIGNTPIVELKRFDTGCCRLFVKLESMNPGGSIKDRPALHMIESAEKAGLIQPGGTLIEATAGNTGLGLALVANQKGYRLVLVLPDKMSQEKIYHLKAVGAEIIMTRSDVQKGHPDYYQDVAARLARETPNAFYINQFANPANVQAHYESTAPEIFQQFDRGQLDAIVCGVGTGGTLTGVGRYMAQHAPHVEMVLADPKGSVLKHYIETGEMTQAKSWLVEGIGEDFIPSICEINLAKKAYEITDQESFMTARALLKEEGILAGSSSGTQIAAAIKYCREQTTPKKVLTFVCDSGNKYFSKMFNDHWMRDQGFLESPVYGDLRDLIARPHWAKDTVTLSPDNTLLMAYNRMRLYSISQMPVIDKGQVVGILDESDILWSVYKNAQQFHSAVSSAMTTRLELIDYRENIDKLLPIFDREWVAIVVDSQINAQSPQFLGIITRIDLINYLKRHMQHW